MVSGCNQVWHNHSHISWVPWDCSLSIFFILTAPQNLMDSAYERQSILPYWTDMVLGRDWTIYGMHCPLEFPVYFYGKLTKICQIGPLKFLWSNIGAQTIQGERVWSKLPGHHIRHGHKDKSEYLLFLSNEKAWGFYGLHPTPCKSQQQRQSD